MKVPDKIFLPRFVYEKWLYQTSDSDDETEVEYIRKDALLEWAKENRDSLGRLSYGEFIDKLNSM